jgi:outer membrane protein assembly factor BamA
MGTRNFQNYFYQKNITKIFSFSIFFLNIVFAQSDIPQNSKAEISSLSMNIEGDISKEMLMGELVTRETPWGLSSFLNENILSSLGSPRSYYDPLIFYNDIIHLYDFLQNKGFFNSHIDTMIIYATDRMNVDISISIKTGLQSNIDTIAYEGLSQIDSALYHSIMQQALLKKGNPFIKQFVVDEQNRIVQELQSNGYPQAKIDSVIVKRFASTNNISIQIQIHTGKKYLFGDIQYVSDDEEKINEDVLSRQIDFTTGEIYSEKKRIISEQNLNQLGLFENVRVRPVFQQDSLLGYPVPIVISYRALEMQEITPELLMLSENNELFSTGLGLGYKHRNLFGGAQNFSINANGRINKVEQYFNYYLLNSVDKPILYSKASLQMQLIFPYFWSNKTSATITLSADAERQESYTLNTLRGKLSFATKLATYTLGTTDFNVERVDPKFENPQSLRVEDTTKQFNFIEAYTLQRNKTNNIFSPTEGFFHSATIEEAGLISKLAGGFGLPYSEYYKLSFLAKHYFGNEAHSHVFALKLQGGFALLYNSHNLTPVPLPRRFFLGGSQSVRAWRDKQLAAFGDTLKGGNIAFEGSIESRTQLFPNGGKFLFLNVENIWSVLFFDYGNTWYKTGDIDLKQVALAVGFGIRYETFVGPFRLDVAWRLYDPKAPIGRQWLYEQSFFHNSYFIGHFGIGHSF